MMLSERRRFVYTAITKTATQTMFKVLAEHYNGYLIENVDAHSTEIPEYARSWFAFTVVRNPYDRAVSLWWSTTQLPKLIEGCKDYGFRAMCPNPDDFAVFCQWLATAAPAHELTRTQSDHVRHARLDAVLRFESLSDDFAKLPFYNGEPVTWPRENQTIDRREPSSHYLTDEAKHWIRCWCGSDFFRFGYAL